MDAAIALVYNVLFGRFLKVTSQQSISNSWRSLSDFSTPRLVSHISTSTLKQENILGQLRQSRAEYIVFASTLSTLLRNLLRYCHIFTFYPQTFVNLNCYCHTFSRHFIFIKLHITGSQMQTNSTHRSNCSSSSLTTIYY